MTKSADTSPLSRLAYSAILSVLLFDIIPMGLPGHRRTSSHKRRRAAHFAITKQNLAECSKCKKPVQSHHACAFCGTYAGRQVTKVKAEHKGHAGHDHGKKA